MPRQLTVNEAARYLNVRIDEVYRLLHSGRLAGNKQNGCWLITQAALDGLWRRKRDGTR